MKIDNVELKGLFSYTNVIVETNEPDLILPIAVPVVKNYKPYDIIGTARPRYLNGGIICNIDVFENAKGLFPGICFNTHPDNNLLYLSLGTEPNIDSKVNCL